MVALRLQGWGCLLLALGTASAHSEVRLRPASRKRPHIHPQWSAKFTLSGAGVLEQSDGEYFQDQVRRRNRQRFSLAFHLFGRLSRGAYDDLNVDVDGLNHNLTVGEGSDAVCKPSREAPFVDMFRGLDQSTFIGHDNVRGKDCELWNVILPDTTNTTACVDPTGIPLRLNTTANLLAGHVTSAFGGVTVFEFYDLKVGPPPEEAFEATAACRDNYPTKPCPVAEGHEVVSLDVYRIRSRTEPNDLWNRNTGDALGDMAFVCLKDAASAYSGKVVTHWRVQANASWGQYAYCLYSGGKNTCLGGTGTQVGRESAFGMGHGALQGQCSPNLHAGSWFSFPLEGQCPPGQAVGTGGCTWSGQAMRSVGAKCIFEVQGLTASCEAEQNATSYKHSAAILEAALASDDPSKGGCPELEEFEEEEAMVI